VILGQKAGDRCSIPTNFAHIHIDKTLAMGIIAEATTDMSKFADERKFAAWAGVASGNNESAGKKKDQNMTRITP
jgi:transposase